jgi:hypothetical protein
MSYKIKEGFIGFFDILGYQNFMENNDLTEPLIEIVNKIQSINEKVRLDFFGKEKPEGFYQMAEKINSISLSDTVIFHMECDYLNAKDRFLAFFVFCLMCNQLQKIMFEFGLPLRGVIDSGKYYIEEKLIAGKIFMKAFTINKDLEIATCVLGDEAQKIHDEITRTKGVIENGFFLLYPKLLTEYQVPCKSISSKKMIALNNLFLLFSDIEIRQYVYNSFWKHNKTIDEKTEKKVNNTEQYFRFLKYKHPDFFIPMEKL